MNIIPSGKIVMSGLNSYYLDIERLCEYCHEVVGSCGIYFKSVSADGALFFDNSDYLGGGLRNNGVSDYDTVDVIEKLVEPASTDNFDITVYQIELEDVYYLSSLFHAKSIYDGLKSDFTDLDALIKKMNAEKLTGYIEVIFDNVHSGDLFFRNGKIIHSNCNMTEDPPDDLVGSDRDLASLIYFSNKKAGIFNVKKIIMCQPSAGEKSAKTVLPAFDASRIYPMLESLLGLLKNVLSEKPPRGFNFDLTLRKKFIEKADKYDFLDPFAAEFQYDNSKVTYEGDADLKLLAAAVLESASELAVENGLSDRFEAKIESVKKQYPKELAEIGYNA
jgi:hypothetical protein